MSGQHEGDWQDAVIECPCVPDRPFQRCSGELCPAVLRYTEADWGHQTHHAPALGSCLHPAAGGSAQFIRCWGGPHAAATTPAQETQQPPAKQRHGAGRRVATLPVQALAKPGGKRKSKRLWDGRPGDGGGCSSGDERITPSPGGRPGRRIFCLFFPRHWPHGQWYPKPRQKSNFLYLWVPRGVGELWKGPSWFTLTLLSHQWAAVEESKVHSIVLLTHPLPECR